MDDVLVVSRFERPADLQGDPDRPIQRQRGTLDERLQVLTLDQLEHQELAALVLLQAVDRRDAGIVQRREKMRLALEARQSNRVTRDGFGQDLDRDLATQALVGGAVHLPHAARSELGGHAVVSECLADHLRVILCPSYRS